MHWLFFTRSSGDLDSMPHQLNLLTDGLKRAFIGDSGAHSFQVIASEDVPKYPTWDGEKYVSALGCECEERDWRKSELSKTDFSVLPDVPFSDEEKEAYKTYRQDLRDWPESADFPNSEKRPKL